MTAPKNPRTLGLPVTVGTKEVVKNLETSAKLDQQRAHKRGRIALDALKPADGLPFGPKAAGADVLTKAQAADAQFRASYQVGDTTPSKVDLRVKDIPGPMLLEVSHIDGYDHNPRLSRNESYEDLEASIRANGFTDSLTVTRRRDGDRYMLAAGSNTTLEILKNLWATTQDERFRWVHCVFQPFESETRLLAQHLGENLNRGNMRFWEIAKGMTDLLDMIERERVEGGQAGGLSVREQTEALAKRGLRGDKSTIARWRFAVDRLSSLGQAALQLTRAEVGDVVQPRLSALKALAAKFKIDEALYWTELVEPVLASTAIEAERGAEPFDAGALCDCVEAALAERVAESVTSIRQMLSTLRVSPELTLADLRAPSPSIVVGTQSRSPAVAPAAPPAESPTSQSSLPLGPGLVRQHGNAPGQPAPRHSTTVVQHGLPPHLPEHGVPAPAPAAQPSAVGALFAAASPGDDPLRELHGAVERLLAAAGLSDTLRWHDPMPLGFFLELPDPAAHPRRKLTPHSPEDQRRRVKTTVWWSLVLMTGQYRDGVVPYIDHSSEYYRQLSVETDGNPLDGTDIDRHAPESEDLLLARAASGPMRVAMQAMREVEEHIARVFEALPERARRMAEILAASPNY